MNNYMYVEIVSLRTNSFHYCKKRYQKINQNEDNSTSSGFKVSEKAEEILAYQVTFVSSRTHFILQQLLLMILHRRIFNAVYRVLNYSSFFNPGSDFHNCVKFYHFSRYRVSMVGR